MRKSIFDIVSENIDLENEAERIFTMAAEEKTLVINGYHSCTLFGFFGEYCFRGWAYRNHCVDIDDYFNTVGLDDLKTDAALNVDSMLTFIELVYNFWIFAQYELQNESMNIKWRGNFYHLRDVMDDILAQYNHIAYIDDKDDRVLVIEDKAQVTAAAEIVPDALTLDVIRYNHKSLQGNIEEKRAILVKFGAELEPKRKELQQINKQLENNIFFMMNNLHIRHNNRSQKDPAKYKEYVAKMKDDRLEKWYDELYQMILLAFLLLDDISREDTVEELKREIVGGYDNG